MRWLRQLINYLSPINLENNGLIKVQHLLIRHLKKFLNDHNIELYHVHNEGKTCVIERINRTLGEMIKHHSTATNCKNYINKLQYLINEYNNKNIHSTIKMTPLQATDPDNINLVFFIYYT